MRSIFLRLCGMLLCFGWGATDAHAQQAVTLDTTGGQFTAIAEDGTGRLAVAYIDRNNNRLKVWYDNGAGGGTAADGLANGSEIRDIDANIGFDNAILFWNGTLVVAYTGQNANTNSGDLRLWIDDGNGGGTPGNGQADGGEIRVIDASPDVGIDPSVTVWNGRLAVAYTDRAGTDLKLWVDNGDGGGNPGNRQAEAGEIRFLDQVGNTGWDISITVWNNQLAVVYYDNPNGNWQNGNLRIWIDDGRNGGTAGNGQAEGGEIRTIDGINRVGGQLNGLAVWNGNLAVSYYDDVAGSLLVWIDDGNGGGGTAGDGVVNGTEVRTIDSNGNVGAFSSIAILNNQLVVSYTDFGVFALKLWRDDGSGSGVAGDGQFNGTEVSTLDPTAGLHTSVTVLGNDVAISYYDLNADALKLYANIPPPQQGNQGGTGGGDFAGGTLGSGIQRATGSGSCFLANFSPLDFSGSFFLVWSLGGFLLGWRALRK